RIDPVHGHCPRAARGGHDRRALAAESADPVDVGPLEPGRAAGHGHRSPLMRRHYTAPMSDAATDAMLVDAASPRRGRGALTALGAVAIYLMAYVLVWGGSAVTRLDTYYITRQDSPDPYFFRWAMTWVPWAIAHGRDPLVSCVIYATYPVTLTWVTLAPGPAIAMWPVTRAFGSLVSYNVLTLLAPALAGWAAFLLCR